MDAAPVPATSMAVAVVADAHLEGPGGDPEPLLAQLEELPGATERLVLLGDLIHVWVGFPQFETPASRALTATLLRLRERGLAIDSIEGNRDFFLGEGPAVKAFDRLGSELGVVVGGRRILFVHGDGLDDNDRQYRRWRALSKSPPVRFAVKYLPRMLASRLVHSTERRLAQTNFKHRKQIPEVVVQRYGARRLAEGWDELVLGHFHEARQWQVEGGSVRILDAWFSSRRIEWIA